MKKIIMIALLAAIAVRGGTGTLTFDWIHADTAAALAAGTDRDKLDAAITNEVDPVAMAALSGYATTGELATAMANLDETDPRAMKLYHYGDPDIQITPESDFTFNAGRITGYTGSNPDIVLPYEIGGVPVVAIGDNAFYDNNVVKTIKASKTLTTIDSSAFGYSSLKTLTAPALTSIGDYAFSGCSLTTLTAPALTSIGYKAFEFSSLTTLTAPSLTSIGDEAFSYSSLTSIYYGGNQPAAGAYIYEGAPDNLTNYVTSATATGWGDMFGDRPVVRLPLYADEVHIKGSLAATQPYVDNAISSIPPVVIPDETDPVAMAALKSPSSHWTTNIVAAGTQTLKGTWGSQPRLQLSGSTTIDIDWTTYDTNGINRISLTIVSGEHPVIWPTNNFEFAEVPELSTTGSSTILIRKVGTEKAQGRQL